MTSTHRNEQGKWIMRGSSAVIAIVVTLVAWGAIASADEKRVEDPEGDGSPDLVAATHGHSSERGASAVLSHRLVFASPPGSGDLAYAEIRIWLPDRDPRFDRRVLIYYNTDGSFRGSVDSGGRVRGFANVFWADDSTLAVEFTKTSIARDLDTYEWRAGVVLTCPPPGDGPCPEEPPEDWVPSKTGKVRHRL